MFFFLSSLFIWVNLKKSHTVCLIFFFFLYFCNHFLVCRAAKADLVFLVDGSWSIGDDNFLKIIRFLYSTVGALDRIGPDGTQVAKMQFHPVTPQYSLKYTPESSKSHGLNSKNKAKS